MLPEKVLIQEEQLLTNRVSRFTDLNIVEWAVKPQNKKKKKEVSIPLRAVSYRN